MENEKCVKILSAFISDLLSDIKDGFGNTELEAPKSDSPFMKDACEGLAKFWNGEVSATKYDLFSAVLSQSVDTDDMLIPTITQVLLDRHVPEKHPEARLTANSLQDIISQACIEANKAVSEPVEESGEVTAVVMQPVPQNANTSSNKRRNEAYDEMIASKKALMKDREARAAAGAK